MMRGLVCALMMGATAVSAFPLETSLRPVARPGDETKPVLVATEALTPPMLRPKARPASDHAAQVLAAIEASKAGPPVPTASEPAATSPNPHDAEEIRVASAAFVLPQALRPITRPHAITQKAILRRQERLQGSVCGDPAIQGEDVGVILASTFGCGVEGAVKIKSISGVALSQRSTMDCTTAQALKKWVDNGLSPAVGTMGGGVAKIDVMGHYVCRTRNNQPGAKISEHGRGRAVDIGGFTLRDGTKISVLNDWSKKSKGKVLKAAYSKACGTFGTTLGPNANRYHRDHFHFDTARYRSGSYCR